VRIRSGWRGPTATKPPFPPRSTPPVPAHTSPPRLRQAALNTFLGARPLTYGRTASSASNANSPWHGLRARCLTTGAVGDCVMFRESLVHLFPPCSGRLTLRHLRLCSACSPGHVAYRRLLPVPGPVFLGVGGEPATSNYFIRSTSLQRQIRLDIVVILPVPGHFRLLLRSLGGKFGRNAHSSATSSSGTLLLCMSPWSSAYAARSPRYPDRVRSRCEIQLDTEAVWTDGGYGAAVTVSSPRFDWQPHGCRLGLTRARHGRISAAVMSARALLLKTTCYSTSPDIAED